MVRRGSATAKDIFREIVNTKGRFISITLLVTLAVGFYSGLRMTKPDMLATADAYLDERRVFDIRIQSNLGMSDIDLSAISEIPGVAETRGEIKIDAIVPANGRDYVVSLQTGDKVNINEVELLEGRLPEKSDECAVEDELLSFTGLKIGDAFFVSAVAESMEDVLLEREFTITGRIRSAVYINKVTRGGTTLGDGRLSAFAVIDRSAVDLDYYTEIDILVAGAITQAAYTDAYDDVVSPVEDALEALAETRAPLRRKELIEEYEQELADARQKLEDGKAELAQGKIDLADAEQKLADARIDLEDGRSELEDGRREYEDGLKEYEDGKKELEDGRKKLSDARIEYEDGLREYEDGLKEYRDGIKEYEDGLEEYNDSKAKAQRELSDARSELEDGEREWNKTDAALRELEYYYLQNRAQWDALPPEYKAMLPEQGAQLNAMAVQLFYARNELDKAKTEIEDGWSTYYKEEADANAKLKDAEQELADAKQELDDAKRELADAEQELADGEKEIKDGEQELLDNEQKLADAELELLDAEKELTDGERELLDGEKEISDGEQKVADGKKDIAESGQKIADAEIDISDGERELADVPEGEWYVLNRADDRGIAGFEDDSDRMGALAGVFPIIFFAVAALVCLTTMTRMVEEQRVELGTFKALGYGKATTAAKFFVYSFTGALIGIALGIGIGIVTLPKFIFYAYSVMYDMPPLLVTVDAGVLLFSAACALICTVGATTAASLNTLTESPAGLLRPRAPKPGKRIMLEYIKPLWRRMSFFSKVSARNIFRYKKRFFMTVVGIGGCTALILTGLGLHDSISGIPNLQFDSLFSYDLQVVFEDDATAAEKDALCVEVENNANVEGYTRLDELSADFSVSGKAPYDGYVIVPEQPEQLQNFIQLGHRLDDEPVSLPEKGAVITEKLSELLSLNIGDTLTIFHDGYYEVRVADIIENYVFHYVYLSPSYYESVFGEPYRTTNILIKCIDSGELAAGLVSSELLKEESVQYVSYFRTVADSFKESMASVDYVIVVIVAAAALLAFIVLFNLANINILERMRELATIKVLGFYDTEVSWYIFRENTVLTLIGIALGLMGGKYLHAWLITSVEVDFTMFGRSVYPLSYLLSALMTFAFAVIVNIIGHLRMKKINMIESLKSVE